MLLNIGSVAFDDIETPYGRAEKVIGGAAVYISWAASYYTQQIQISAIVGDDWPVEEIRKMEARGVDTEGLQIVKDGKSFFWAGKYSENLNERETLITDLNVLDDFDPTLPEGYKYADFVMLGNLTPEIQLNVIRQMEKRPSLIAMDTMNFWMDVAWDSLLLTIKEVDLLVINDEEARQLSGEYSLRKAARTILNLGPKYLVVKKGEHGALLFHEDDVFFAAALPLHEVVDPTGAGDTFAGGMMGYLDMTKDISYDNLKRALIHGSIMASFCVEAFSLDKLQNITAAELEARKNEFKGLMHVEI